MSRMSMPVRFLALSVSEIEQKESSLFRYILNYLTYKVQESLKSKVLSSFVIYKRFFIINNSQARNSQEKRIVHKTFTL